MEKLQLVFSVICFLFVHISSFSEYLIYDIFQVIYHMISMTYEIDLHWILWNAAARNMRTCNATYQQETFLICEHWHRDHSYAIYFEHAISQQCVCYCVKMIKLAYFTNQTESIKNRSTNIYNIMRWNEFIYKI